MTVSFAERLQSYYSRAKNRDDVSSQCVACGMVLLMEIEGDGRCAQCYAEDRTPAQPFDIDVALEHDAAVPSFVKHGLPLSPPPAPLPPPEGWMDNIATPPDGTSTTSVPIGVSYVDKTNKMLEAVHVLSRSVTIQALRVANHALAEARKIAEKNEEFVLDSSALTALLHVAERADILAEKALASMPIGVK